MDPRDLTKLQEPMPEDAVEWRIQSAGKKGGSGDIWALCVPYINAQWAMQRLDEVCGIAGWGDAYLPGPNGGIMCALSIWIDDDREGFWLTKHGIADNTDIEATKGGETDAFKRACRKWNVGNCHALYMSGETWANVNPRGRHRDSLPKAKGGDRFRWDPPHIDTTIRARAPLPKQERPRDPAPKEPAPSSSAPRTPSPPDKPTRSDAGPAPSPEATPEQYALISELMAKIVGEGLSKRAKVSTLSHYAGRTVGPSAPLTAEEARVAIEKMRKHTQESLPGVDDGAAHLARAEAEAEAHFAAAMARDD